MSKPNDGVTAPRLPLFCDGDRFKRVAEILLTSLDSGDSLPTGHSPSLTLDSGRYQSVNLVMIPNIDWNDFGLSNNEFKRNPVLQVDRDTM